MKYKNASEILPDKLLKEVQKYAAGENLYVPAPNERKDWGHESGAKMFYKERNESIKQKYFHKISIERLAEEYGLATETIRKIVYK